MEIPNYYAILPAVVRYHPDLTPSAKLLYAEITALCNKTGECWATNKYFSELYGVDDRTISRWISSLVKAGILKVSLDQSAGNVRTLFPIDIPIDKNVVTPDKNVLPPPDKNVYHNNTSKNNTRIETNRESDLQNQVGGLPLPDETDFPSGSITAVGAAEDSKGGQGKTKAVSTKTDFVSDKFEEFWKSYMPVHTDKGAKKKAKEIFLAKAKKEDPDEIIRGMNKYISACHSTGSYTQNVTTFLNQEHWKDYLEEEQLAFRNPYPFVSQDYNQDMTADDVVAVVWSHINEWWSSNQGLANRISAITKEVRNPTILNYHQKALQMALELAKKIFRCKDSPEIKCSPVDPLFWLSHKDVITELYVATKMSGVLYLGYQLGRLAKEG